MSNPPPDCAAPDCENITHLGDAVFADSSPPGSWTPLRSRQCSFGPEIFTRTMLNFARHPNLNTSWLFRADILFDDASSTADTGVDNTGVQSRAVGVEGFRRTRTMVRRLIPRNTRRDQPLDQTCLFYHNVESSGHADTGSAVRSLVVYIPHETDVAKFPFYHPKVRGVAHLHEWDPTSQMGSISVHFCFFAPASTIAVANDGEGDDQTVDRERLERTAVQLLNILHKHGEGQAAGYVKRVQHDVLVPQVRSQDRYTQLKLKYAQSLCESWTLETDPVKHVFEDLSIAAFLMELWADMYGDDMQSFPGFVDIGCGNGLLVKILRLEQYKGWGFDARERKSWAGYQMPGAGPNGNALAALVLLPRLALEAPALIESLGEEVVSNTHDGVFPSGTFIISNHADELTPWTPLLAAASDCPFISIPCCSHNLTGARWRAPPPRKRETKNPSAYASLVDWVTRIAEDCGWQVETEMLRIPSTRNTSLLGRKRRDPGGDPLDLQTIIARYGGSEGFAQSALALAKSKPRGH